MLEEFCPTVCNHLASFNMSPVCLWALCGCLPTNGTNWRCETKQAMGEWKSGPVETGLTRPAATALMYSTIIKTHNLEVVSSYSCLLVQKIIVTNECNAHVSPMLCRCMRGVCVSTTLKESTVISVRLGSTMCPGPLEQTRKPMPAKVCS